MPQNKKNLLLIIFLALVVLTGVAIFIFQNKQNIPKIGQSTAPTQGSAEQVVVMTDKNTYAKSEIAKITLTNNLKESIFISLGTPGIEYIEKKKINSEEWEQFPAMCHYPNCIYDIGPPEELKIGESKSFDWQLLFFPEEKSKSVGLEPGLYRIAFQYRIGTKDSAFRTAKSNEFTILKE